MREFELSLTIVVLHHHHHKNHMKISTHIPNSKLWITSHVECSLRDKQKVFQWQDWTSINRQIKNDIMKAKLKYEDRFEQI